MTTKEEKKKKKKEREREREKKQTGKKVGWFDIYKLLQ